MFIIILHFAILIIIAGLERKTIISRIRRSKIFIADKIPNYINENIKKCISIDIKKNKVKNTDAGLITIFEKIKLQFLKNFESLFENCLSYRLIHYSDL